VEDSACATRAARMARFVDTDLYVVITESFCGGRSAEAVLAACLDAGVRLVQFRKKGAAPKVLQEQARAFCAQVHAVDGVLIINDDVNLALAAGADGVHLGQGDMPVAEARQLGPELILGVSTHSVEEAVAAQESGADYVNIGPIFATQTKELPMGPLGLGGLEEIAPHVKIPFSCMGGIKAENIGEVVARGCRHPAVVTAVTQAEDVCAAAKALREQVLAGR
jgi:thiamine-phosphate pyrophosphorylase